VDFKKDILDILNNLKSIGIDRRTIERELDYKTYYIDQIVSKGGNKLAVKKLQDYYLKKRAEFGKRNSVISFSSDTERELIKRHLSQNDRQLYYFTQFIYYCFIRRSELTRLRIENIDWGNRTIVIPSHVSKNKKQESVVIPDSFFPILEQINLKSLPADYYIFGRKLQPGRQQYVNYNHISTRHNIISKSLGIDDAKGLYSWKHSGVCSLYYALSGDIYSLMRQLRHSDLKITQIYLKSLGLIDNAAVRSAKW
jgi:integrase